MAFIYAAMVLFSWMGAHAMELPPKRPPSTPSEKRASLVRDLLTYLADPFFDEETEFIKFLTAILAGDLATFQSFMERRDINLFATDGLGRTALLYAVAGGDRRMIMPLIGRGGSALINMKDLHNSTALQVAADLGYREFVIELLRHGAEVACSGNHHLGIAYLLEIFKDFQRHLGLWEMMGVEKMVHAENVINSCMTTDASRSKEHRDYTKIARFEHEMLEDIIAGRELRVDHIKEVLDVQQKLHLLGDRLHLLFLYTILYDLPNLFDFLVHFSIESEHGIPWLDENNRSLLFYTSVLDTVPMARTLMQEGALILVNHRDNQGVTPLHAAVVSGSYASALLLITFGADSTVPDATGTTPMDSAQAHGFVAMIDLFNDSRSCIFVVDDSFVVPLASESVLSEERGTVRRVGPQQQVPPVNHVPNPDEFFENYYLTPAFRACLSRTVKKGSKQLPYVKDLGS